MKRNAKFKLKSKQRRINDNKVQIVVRDPRLEMTSKSQLSDKRSLMKSNRHTTSDKITENSPVKVKDSVSRRNSYMDATLRVATHEHSMTEEEEVLVKSNGKPEISKQIDSLNTT